ncbi:MAG: transglutaminase-like domain-containing protein [Defluviitaleaceae bacterium]|nr:transglutaminase-like domain-containing protein [Defluviitaleaceae bacterium]MCL2274969.1 transglutaminase-like domain-containing protein [Defluviitaleaceae bacterium]
MKTKNEYLFLLGVGGAYLFAVTRGILSATVIAVPPLTLYAMGLFSLLVFTLLLFNKKTRIAAGVFVALAALFIFWQRDVFEPLINHYSDVFLMATGYIPFRPELGRTMTWLIVLALGFFVVVFALYKFNFYVLAIGGVLVFALTWMSSFLRDSTSFLVFVFAFVLIFIRKTSKGIPPVALAAPVCFLVILIAQIQLPAYSEAFTRRTLRDAFEGRFHAIEDFFFEIFNPTYFSFAQTGFAQAGGRLGGPVTLNDRHVMEVHAPGLVYLSGATHNYFTGYAWVTTLQAGDINTHGYTPGHFEMLETTAALMRNAGLARGVDALNAGVLRAAFPNDPARYLNFHTFAVIRTVADEVFIPPGYVEIDWVRAVGTRQTGFRDQPGTLTMGEGTVTAYITENFIFVPTEFDDDDDNDVNFFVSSGLSPRLFCENYYAWLDVWQTANPLYGDIPRPDGDGVVHYYWHAYLPMSTMSIGMGRNRTGTVFRTPHSRQVWFDDTSFDYQPNLLSTPGGDTRTPGFMRRNTIYHQHFLHINPNLSFIENILHASYAGLYAARGAGLSERITQLQETEPYNAMGVHFAINTASMDMLASFPSQSLMMMETLFINYARHGLGTPRIGTTMPSREMQQALYDLYSSTVLAAYAESIRAHFLQVPEITPPRVHELTASIIRYHETDFARIMAIRDFLMDNFPYTLTPVPVPRDVCFVDFFLFEGREGYCTYFASAMALMSRIAGIPARYVEGFFVPGIGRHEYAVTSVTNQMAHAWVEVYFEGFGWLIVEATPPHALYAEALNRVGNAANRGDLWYRWYEDEILEEDMWLHHMRGPGQGGPGGQASPAAIAYEPEVTSLLQMILLTALFILSFVALIALYLFICRARNRLAILRISKLTPNQQAQAYFKGILAISEYYHKPLIPGETTLAYARRAGKRFAFQSDAVFLKDLISLYNRAKFGKNQISQEELALMKDAHATMVNLLYTMRRRPRFVYLHYVRRVGAVTIS